LLLFELFLNVFKESRGPAAPPPLCEEVIAMLEFASDFSHIYSKTCSDSFFKADVMIIQSILESSKELIQNYSPLWTTSNSALM